MISELIRRAANMGIAMSTEQAERFQAYHTLLIEANAQFNLTRVPEETAEAIDRNYLDSIAPVLTLPEGIRRVVDVGSGAGFPGIPLSIMRPELEVVLMDSLSKRVDFLNLVCGALNLNAHAVHLRAEDGARRPEYREAFDLATARAVASLNLLSEYLLPFVRVGGWMLALKGPTLAQELEEAGNALRELGGRFVREECVQIPGRDWDHRLAYIQKIENTPEKYPRKAGKPEKRPL